MLLLASTAATVVAAPAAALAQQATSDTANLVWTPTENLTLSLAPRYNHNVSSCSASAISELTPGLFYQGIPTFPAALTLRGVTFDKNNHFVRADDRIGGGNSDVFGTTARIDYDFGEGSVLKGHTLSSITSHDRWKMVDFQDIDGTDQPFLLGFPVAIPSGINSGAHIDGYFHADSWTQEFRLTSPGRHAVPLCRRPLVRQERSRPLPEPRPGAAAGPLPGPKHQRELLGLCQRHLGHHRQAGPDRRRRHQPAEDQLQVRQDHLASTAIGAATTHQLFGRSGYKGQAYELVSTFDARIAAQMPAPPETAKSYELGFKSSLLNRRVYFNAPSSGPTTRASRPR